MRTPDEKEIKGFLEKYGSQGRRLTELLESIAPDIVGIKSAGGWGIIKDDVERWKLLALKTLSGKASAPERNEVAFLTNTRLPAITQKLITWYKGIGLIYKKPEGGE